VRQYVTHLTRGVAIYGAGDAAVQALSFLLLPIYVKFGFLDPSAYGAISIIIAIEMLAKVVSRWGLDGALMRFYHDRPAGGPLELLTSTIVWFTLAANGLVFGAALGGALLFGGALLEDMRDRIALIAMLMNTFLISLTYVPLHLMRLRDQAVTFSAIALGRSAGTVVARLALVIGLGWGVAGWFIADVIVTLVTWPVLWKWMRPLVQPRFSAAELRLVLRFGLPRLPHGLAQQGLDAGNKLLLSAHLPQSQQGVYQNGFTVGTAIRFFTSAFETAWAPFYYSVAKTRDAARTYGKVTTYGVAVLALLVAITSATAREIVIVMLNAEYLGAVPVIPLIATGMAMQGIYLLTSIGLNLTSQTRYYPVATTAALVVGLGAGAVLMPKLGMTGAALAFLGSTMTQAGVAFMFARRAYPVAYEPARLARVLIAAVIAGLTAAWIWPALAPLGGLFLRPTVAVTVFISVLALSGFFRQSERAYLAELLGRRSGRLQ
jgi:O-antigen/teichoic acid export membrane protein